MQSSKQESKQKSSSLYMKMWLETGNCTCMVVIKPSYVSKAKQSLLLYTGKSDCKLRIQLQSTSACLETPLSLSLGVMQEFEQQWCVVHRSLVQLEVGLGLQTSSSGEHQRPDVAVESLVHRDNAHMQNTKPTNHCQHHQQTSSTPMCLISLQERKKSTSPSAPGGWSINQ